MQMMRAWHGMASIHRRPHATRTSNAHIRRPARRHAPRGSRSGNHQPTRTDARPQPANFRLGPYTILIGETHRALAEPAAQCLCENILKIDSDPATLYTPSVNAWLITCDGLSVPSKQRAANTASPTLVGNRKITPTSRLGERMSQIRWPGRQTEHATYHS